MHAMQYVTTLPADYDMEIIRRRVVEPDRWGKPSFTERLNAPVQGAAADILKLALAKLWEEREAHPEAFPILAVHDEIVVECDERDTEKVEAWLKKAMIDGMDEVVNGLKADGPLVPIEVEVESGKSWGGE